MLRKFLNRNKHFVYAFVTKKHGHTFRLLVVAQTAEQARAYVNEAGYSITSEGNFFETKTNNVGIIAAEKLS